MQNRYQNCNRSFQNKSASRHDDSNYIHACFQLHTMYSAIQGRLKKYKITSNRLSGRASARKKRNDTTCTTRDETPRSKHRLRDEPHIPIQARTPRLPLLRLVRQARSPSGRDQNLRANLNPLPRSHKLKCHFGLLIIRALR